LGTSRLRLGYNCIGYDYIVSNPPYVPDTEQISGPAASDPRNALFAGNTGLDLISKIITGAPNLLKPQGLLLLEHHASQRSTLIKLFQQSRWRTLRCFNDLNGLPRFMLAQRAEKSAN
jgi:release factor glutamine methyltransferase